MAKRHICRVSMVRLSPMPSAVRRIIHQSVNDLVFDDNTRIQADETRRRKSNENCTSGR